MTGETGLVPAFIEGFSEGFSRWSVAVGVIAMVVGATPATAGDPKAVVELFTSQGCSSCPAADKLLGELAKDPSIVAISLPIDYWDYLGWKDTLADPRFSARQKAYSLVRGDREVYTPQVVVNGTAHVLGSDRNSIESAVASTRKATGIMSVPVTMTIGNGKLNVSVPAAKSENESGEIWVCAVSRSVPIAIGRGENRGREVTYTNVVRNVLKVGDWNGKAGSWSVPLENITRDGVDAAVVFVQDGNREKPGPMKGAAYTALQ
ncbi:MAG: hypothetical protein A4S14_15105 [Proteobacteria bacterium SG_bin9]|nr:MAG: hypothetical protein A4S14_15105 [Proteobacteria bacterium SG_bin9]